MTRGPLQRWLDRLAALGHFAVARIFEPDTDAAILEISEDDAALIIRKDGASKCVARAARDGAGLKRLSRALAKQGGKLPLLLRLPGSWVLQKQLTIPAAARRHLDGFLGFEMDRETPFARDEVHWAYAVRGQDLHGRLTVDLVVAPRVLVDPILESATAAGLDPGGIEIAGAADTPVVMSLGETERWHWLHTERALVAMAAAACVLAVVAAALPFVRQERAIAAADGRIAQLTAQAEEAARLRQSVDVFARTFTYLAEERQRQASGLQVLSAATRALDDDTYLTGLTFRDGRLTLTGLSASAAGIIGTLANTPGFHEPAFDSPVVQSEDDDLEAFTISVDLKPAGQS